MTYWLLLAAGVIGLGVGGYFVVRSPSFWIALVTEAAKVITPALQELGRRLARPLSPEDQKKYEQSYRRAQEWDNFRKRPRDR